VIRSLYSTAIGKYQAPLGALHVVRNSMIGKLFKPEFLAKCEVSVSFSFSFSFQIKDGSVIQFSWISKFFTFVFRLPR